MSELADRILRIRNTLGITQSELSRRVGVRRNTISQYESGSATPSAEVLIRFFHVATKPDDRQFLLEYLTGLAFGAPVEVIQQVVHASRSPERKTAADLLIVTTEKKIGAAPIKASARQLLKEVAGLVDSEEEIEPEVVRLIRLYRQSFNRPKARRAAFRRAIEYLHVELGVSN